MQKILGVQCLIIKYCSIGCLESLEHSNIVWFRPRTKVGNYDFVGMFSLAQSMIIFHTT